MQEKKNSPKNLERERERGSFLWWEKIMHRIEEIVAIKSTFVYVKGLENKQKLVKSHSLISKLSTIKQIMLCNRINTKLSKSCYVIE